MDIFKGVISPKLRKKLYAALVVGGLGFTAWQTADGDVVEAVSGFVTALTGLMAFSNVDTSEDEV